MSLQGAVEWVQDQALTISGVGSAPDNPSELAGMSTLFVVTFPVEGEIGSSAANWGRDYDNIQVMILTSRGDLNEAMQRLEGFPHNLARKIQADLTMGTNVSQFENMSYRFTATQWNGVECVGYILTINRVKQLTTF
jgi:hypothetical protein